MDPSPLDKTKWPQVGLIRSYFPGLGGWYAIGTGTLINRRAILTAAHVIYDPSKGGEATNFEVFFGTGATTTAAGKNGRVLQQWIDSTNPDPSSLNPISAYDAGVIVLDPTSAVDGVAPAAVRPTLLDDLRGHDLNVVGYPIQSDFSGGLAGGQCSPINMGPPWNGYRVAYPIMSLPGMSGGPVYRTDEVSLKTISIRTVNTSIYNGMGNGLMIYPDLAAQIGNWVGEVV